MRLAAPAYRAAVDLGTNQALAGVPVQHVCLVHSPWISQRSRRYLSCALPALPKAKHWLRLNCVSLGSMTVRHAVGESVVVPGLKLTDHTFQVQCFLVTFTGTYRQDVSQLVSVAALFNPGMHLLHAARHAAICTDLV